MATVEMKAERDRRSVPLSACKRITPLSLPDNPAKPWFRVLEESHLKSQDLRTSLKRIALEAVRLSPVTSRSRLMHLPHLDLVFALFIIIRTSHRVIAEEA